MCVTTTIIMIITIVIIIINYTHIHIKQNFLHMILNICYRAGSYEHGVTRNRHVKWHQSFGGAPIKLPDVHIKSTIGTNTAKLLSTRDAKKHHRRLAYLKLYWE